MSRVTISFLNRKIQVNPTRVVLRRGEYLNWDIRVEQNDLTVQTFLFEIYFQTASPFNFGTKTRFDLQMRNYSAATLPAGSADVPGDYKYGVRIRNAITREILEDEDPYITVS